MPTVQVIKTGVATLIMTMTKATAMNRRHIMRVTKTGVATEMTLTTIRSMTMAIGMTMTLTTLETGTHTV